jgi:hypothetical protein
MSEMTEQEFWAALAPGPEPDPPRFRLYHDEQGWPLFYSMEEVAGNYIEIDRDTYQNPPTRVRVVDGKLKVLSSYQSEKLVPGSNGVPCATTDVCVVVDHTHPHTKWNLEKYDPS